MCVSSSFPARSLWSFRRPVVHVRHTTAAIQTSENTVPETSPNDGPKPESSGAAHIEKTEDYEIDDIVWAKIGKYPLWPSIVGVDPNEKIHTKRSSAKTNHVFLRVRFFNDNGQRK